MKRRTLVAFLLSNMIHWERSIALVPNGVPNAYIHRRVLIDVLTQNLAGVTMSAVLLRGRPSFAEEIGAAIASDPPQTLLSGDAKKVSSQRSISICLTNYCERSLLSYFSNLFSSFSTMAGFLNKM